MDAKLYKQFKEDHPETIGEEDRRFDEYNYLEWLEKKYKSKQSETGKRETIEDFIQFVALAGGEVDLTQARYWGYTYLEQQEGK